MRRITAQEKNVPTTLGLFVGNTLLVFLAFMAGVFLLLPTGPAVDPKTQKTILSLVEIAIFSGLIISFSGFIDFIQKLEPGRRFVAIFVGFLFLLIIGIRLGKHFDGFPLVMAFAGLVAASFSISEFVKPYVLSEFPLGYTVGHATGVGLIPFYSGLLLSYLFGLVSLSQLRSVPVLVITITIVIPVIFVARHKWLEEEAKTLVPAMEKFELLTKYTDQIMYVQDTAQGIEKDRTIFTKRMLQYYMYASWSFPLAIAAIYYAAAPGRLFLIFALASYLIIVIGFFDYPSIISGPRKYLSFIFRLVSVFLFIGGLAISSALRVWYGWDLINYFTYPGPSGTMVLMTLVSMIGILLRVGANMHRFYRQRFFHYIWSGTILAGIHLFGKDVISTIFSVQGDLIADFTNYSSLAILLILIYFTIQMQSFWSQNKGANDQKSKVAKSRKDVSTV